MAGAVPMLVAVIVYIKLPPMATEVLSAVFNTARSASGAGSSSTAMVTESESLTGFGSLSLYTVAVLSSAATAKSGAATVMVSEEVAPAASAPISQRPVAGSYAWLESSDTQVRSLSSKSVT